MREDEPLDGTNRTAAAADELAAALGGLRPAAPRTSPRQVWYQAGFEAGRRRANAWRAASVASTAVAAGLLLFLAAGRNPGGGGPAVVVERIVYVPSPSTLPPPPDRPPPTPAGPSGPPLQPSASASASTAAAADWAAASSPVTSIRLQDAVLRNGWTALPPSRGSGAAAEPVIRAGTPDLTDWVDDLTFRTPHRSPNSRG